MNNQNSPKTRNTNTGLSKRNCGILAGITAILGMCCVLGLAGMLAYRLMNPIPRRGPIVFFRNPTHGMRLPYGEAVSVHAIARDERRVTRVELWVDDALLHTQTSSQPEGVSPFPIITNWQPTSPGAHTLTVRAFNAQKGRAQASVTVEMLVDPDRDNDGTPDAVDACPDEPGTAMAGGCPDRDGDGIADANDACPDQAGLPENNGCPLPSESDRDGDGVLDAADACPDEPGSPLAGGCPDADGDGVPDATDACPTEPGPAENDGCPAPAGLPDDSSPPVISDRDGDGVPDSADLCPDVPGDPRNAGCPPSGAGDRDGDGLADDVDLCPDEPGLPEHAGCPPPGAGDDADGDGIPDAEEPGDDPLGGVEGEGFLPEGVMIEFQALEFQLSEGYDTFTCYARVGSSEARRLGEYTIDGARRWDLTSMFIDDSVFPLIVQPGSPLPVYVECGAHVVFLGPEGGWGTYYDLGSFDQLHPPVEWDGQVITVNSSGSTDGRSFQAKYRICQPSCDLTALPAPHLHLFHMGSDHRLVWMWEGERERVDSYRVFLNGSHIFTLPAGTSSFSVGDFAPPCAERYEFQLSVMTTDGLESPLSNFAYWSGATCRRTVQVTFESLENHNPPADEQGLHRPGPIYGNFSASGASASANLPFDACWCYHGPGASIWGWCEGLKLSRSVYNIQTDIFDWIDREMASCLGNGCHSNSFHTPGSSTVTLEMDADEDLTLYGLVMDCDARNPDDIVFQEQETLTITTSGDNPPPVRWTLPGPHLNLNVIITILSEE